MTKKIFTLIFVAILGSLLISSCTSSSMAAATSWPGITADTENEVVYLSSGSYVYAVSSKNGSEIWRYPEEPARGVTFYAPATVADDLIVVGDYKTSLHAINSNTGSEAWIFDEAKDKYVGASAYASDSVFAPSADYNIYALDLNTGDLNFTIKAEKSNWASAVSDGSTVYVPSMDHSVYAFDAASGDLAWQTDVDGAIAAAPTLQDGVLYIATLNEEAVALDTTDGSILWRTPVKDFTWAPPTLIDETLIVVNGSGEVFALDTADGSIIWSADSGGEATAAAVEIENGFVVVTHDGEVVSFTLDGGKQWTRSINSETGSLPSTPVVIGELIIIPVAQSSENLIVAFDMNGNEIWGFAPEK